MACGVPAQTAVERQRQLQKRWCGSCKHSGWFDVQAHAMAQLIHTEVMRLRLRSIIAMHSPRIVTSDSTVQHIQPVLHACQDFKCKASRDVCTTQSWCAHNKRATSAMRRTPPSQA
eukprot:1232119-Amphidinium_carterae.1